MAPFSDFAGLWATGLPQAAGHPALVFRAEEGHLPGGGAGGGGRAWPGCRHRSQAGSWLGPWLAAAKGGHLAAARRDLRGQNITVDGKFLVCTIHRLLWTCRPGPRGLIPVACTSHLVSQPKFHFISPPVLLSVCSTAEPTSPFILNSVGRAGEQETSPQAPILCPSGRQREEVLFGKRRGGGTQGRASSFTGCTHRPPTLCGAWAVGSTVGLGLVSYFLCCVML